MVSRNKAADDAAMMDLQAMMDEPLDPELRGWVEDGTWGDMLRHPMVYQIPLMTPGHANRTLAYKRKALADALIEHDYHTVVFLHERAYRLNALIDFVTGRDEDGDVLPCPPEAYDLAEAVWVDSENINQNLDDWRALFGEGLGLWLGDLDAFDTLPDPIPAYRGGSVGDWSWTTDKQTAAFFSRRSGLPIRSALIPKVDCFGYLTRRGESELLVRLTDERRALVYPEGEPE